MVGSDRLNVPAIEKGARAVCAVHHAVRARCRRFPRARTLGSSSSGSSLTSADEEEEEASS